MKLFGIVASGKTRSQINKVLSRMESSFRIECSRREYFVESGIGVGHLGIGGVNENQPAFSEGERFCAMFCGRIYGHEKQREELSREDPNLAGISDAEYILRSYEKYGKNFAKNLNGVFVIAIWDKQEKELTIINDRWGIKPFYYYRDQDSFIFASEVKAIIASKQVKKQVNWDGWRDMFSYGYLLGEKTLFQNVSSLPIASVTTHRVNSTSMKQYWHYEDVKVDYGKSEDFFVERGIDVLRNSVGKQTKGMKKAQVLLSGGYDSRAVACSLRRFSNVGFHTITGILHGTGPKDIEYASPLSRRLNARNTQVLEDGDIYEKYFIDMIYLLDGLSFEHLWAMPVAEKLERGIPSLDGLAGDLWFTEVHALPFDKLRKRFSKEEATSTIYRNINNGDCGLCLFFNSEFQARMKPSNSSIAREVSRIMQTDYFYATFFGHNRARNSLSLIPSNIFGSKAPPTFLFLDNDLVDLAMSIPPDMKIRSQIYLKILKKIFPEAMTVPTTHDRTAIEVCFDWFGRALKRILVDYHLIKVFNKLNLRISEHPRFRFLNKNLSALPPKREDLAYLERLVKNLEEFPPFLRRDYLHAEIDSHKKDKRDFGYFLVPIAAFCLWYNLFYKDNPEKPEDLKKRLAQERILPLRVPDDDRAVSYQTITT